MKKLVYKIHKIEFETGITILVSKGNETKIKNEFTELIKEDGFDYDLSAGWELNGKSLGTTLLETK
jgi:hypothetical protein